MRVRVEGTHRMSHVTYHRFANQQYRTISDTNFIFYSFCVFHTFRQLYNSKQLFVLLILLVVLYNFFLRTSAACSTNLGSTLIFLQAVLLVLVIYVRL